MLRLLLLQASIARRTSSACLYPHLAKPSSPALLLKRCLSSSSPQIPNGSFVEQLEDNTNQTTPQATATISIDRSGLCNPPGVTASPIYFVFCNTFLFVLFDIMEIIFVKGRAFSWTYIRL